MRDSCSYGTGVYSLFPTTRDIIKDNGRDCIEFTKAGVENLTTLEAR